MEVTIVTSSILLQYFYVSIQYNTIYLSFREKGGGGCNPRSQRRHKTPSRNNKEKTNVMYSKPHVSEFLPKFNSIK